MMRTMMLAALMLSSATLAQDKVPGGAINAHLGDMDYGVCRGTEAACFHGWPRAKTAKYRVLLFTRTAGPRHAGLGPALGKGLNPELAAGNAIQVEMVRIAHAQGWDIDWTEDLSQMKDLKAYNAVVFVSTSRDTLDDDAKTALRQYMRAGGGFVGVHNAFGTMYNWPYYEGLLGGANFYDHGPYRPGTVKLEAPRDPSLAGVAPRFGFQDEWYDLVPFPTHVRFLATVDEKSYGAPVQQPRPPASAFPAGFAQRRPSVVGEHPGHGTFHPVAWCQYYDGGKAWLTTLGHDAAAYKTGGSFPGAADFQTLLVGGIKSVMGETPFCTG